MIKGYCTDNFSIHINKGIEYVSEDTIWLKGNGITSDTEIKIVGANQIDEIIELLQLVKTKVNT